MATHYQVGPNDGWYRRLNRLVMLRLLRSNEICGLSLVLMMILYAGGASSQATVVRSDLSCAHFSPDENDTSGPPIYFYADMNADEESAVTESPGSARADFVLERSTLKLSWKLTYSQTTSPVTGVHIHGPQTPGGEAGIIVDMAPEGLEAITLPAEGTAILTEGTAIYLVQDRLYVNLHTTTYPGGELRGHIKKARPNC